ncbi:AMP-binding protein [Motiliproteus sp. SC1-56]|uniref:AMP-binding protein n=1 Tax=Motiliproteus sp. SC1-56 TaxID=2799565 RepID=UPI001A8C405B|nr:AMP-binding protein [Motiliproteus sp. SC1-56]
MSVAQLVCPLYRAAGRWPEQPALEEGSAAVTFRTLEREVSHLCRQLSEYGVQPGDRLALATDDRGAIVRWLLAALRLELCAVVLNPSQPDAALAAQIERAVPNWLVTERTLEGVALDGFDPRLFAARPPSFGNDAPVGVEIRPDRPYTGVFTSGSSGTPKLALHSYRNHHASALGSQQLIPLGPGDRWAAVLPFYHVGGLALIFRCLLAGACLQIPDPERPLADLVRDAAGPTHLSAVSTQVLRLQNEGRRLDQGCLRTLLLGGSAFPQGLLEWLAPQSVNVLISYGLTEMSSQVMSGPVNADGVLARLLPGRELKIAPDGEILVRGATLFLGYDEGGMLRRPLDNDGWFHTRDLGDLAAEGLRVLGRQDNQFISGGENIQPEEIEAWIARYPGVERCVVVPVDDAEFGQRPVALVAGLALPDDAEGLRAWLRLRIAGYKVPRVYLPLPQTTGTPLKIQRQPLQQLATRMLAAEGRRR